jgi:hypothetical protein
MKTRILRNLFVITLSLMYVVTFGQDDFSKNYEKSYDVNKSTFFKISNKYGKVHIENINTDKVEILVTLNVETKNKEKAENFFDKIDINIDKSGNTITAETEIDGDLKAKHFSIDYYIKMPSYLKIDLTNKYGEIFINKLTSKSTITCKYGHLQINELLTSELENLATVNIKYSKGAINTCDYLNLEIKYSEMEIDKSKAVYVNSGYSQLEFDKAYILKIVSKYDPNFEIKEATKIELEGKYSGYEIGKLANSISGIIAYSNIEIDNVSKGFEKIDLNSKYGNIEIDVDDEASYKLNASNEYGSIDCKIEDKIDSEGTSEMVEGFVGSDKTSKSLIKLVSKYGNIEVE